MAELLDVMADPLRAWFAMDDAGVVPEPPCQRCGSPQVTLELGREDPSKPVKRTCCACGAVTWPALARNERRRRDHNSAHRKAWRQRQGGEMRCAVCERRSPFEIDHILDLELGGDDGLENTVPHCRHCHTLVHSIRDIYRSGRP